ncbi:DUF488 domain-containing protein [Sphingobacteruim zhuxiongii]|nr:MULTISPECIES: DUF488 family protein [unclassified Sphingobacterium]
MMLKIQIKRIYDEYAESDGYRILVDRLWPRGIAKDKAKIDEWNKTLPPSTELRKAFNHQPELFEQFKEAYVKELATHIDDIMRVAKIAETRTVTLLYGRKDPQVNHAIVLKEFILSKA